MGRRREVTECPQQAIGLNWDLLQKEKKKKNLTLPRCEQLVWRKENLHMDIRFQVAPKSEPSLRYQIPLLYFTDSTFRLVLGEPREDPGTKPVAWTLQGRWAPPWAPLSSPDTLRHPSLCSASGQLPRFPCPAGRRLPRFCDPRRRATPDRRKRRTSGTQSRVGAVSSRE